MGFWDLDWIATTENMSAITAFKNASGVSYYISPQKLTYRCKTLVKILNIPANTLYIYILRLIMLK